MSQSPVQPGFVSLGEGSGNIGCLGLCWGVQPWTLGEIGGYLAPSPAAHLEFDGKGLSTWRHTWCRLGLHWSMALHICWSCPLCGVILDKDVAFQPLVSLTEDSVTPCLVSSPQSQTGQHCGLDAPHGVSCVPEALADLQPLPRYFWGLAQHPARPGHVVTLYWNLGDFSGIVLAWGGSLKGFLIWLGHGCSSKVLSLVPGLSSCHEGKIRCPTQSTKSRKKPWIKCVGGEHSYVLLLWKKNQSWG